MTGVLWPGGLDRNVRTMRRQTASDERGQMVSAFVAVILAAIFLAVGLVIDGGQKINAAARAQSAAAGASRAAGNAAARLTLGDRDPAAAAVRAARTYLAGQPGVTGTVAVQGTVVTVDTSATEPALFLAVIGIEQLVGRGSATASLVPTGATR